MDSYNLGMISQSDNENKIDNIIWFYDVHQYDCKYIKYSYMYDWKNMPKYK